VAERSKDCILFKDREPTNVLGVEPDDQPTKPRLMEAFDISNTEKHGMTFYSSGKMAHGKKYRI
jgi:hypothetical protein